MTMKKFESYIGLACELIEGIAAVIAIVDFVLKLMGLTINYPQARNAILQT
jgi:hypothetical protein